MPSTKSTRGTVVAAGGRDVGDGQRQRRGVAARDVPQGDVRRDRLELDAQAQRVAERAVGVREAVEQGGVLVAGRGGHDPAVAGQHVELEDGLVRAAVAPRRALDAEPGDRAAERDRAQLRHAERHEAVRQRRRDEVLVRRHAEHVGRPRLGVDLEHAAERRDVEPGGRRGRAGAEQVRGALGQPHRRPRAGSRGTAPASASTASAYARRVTVGGDGDDHASEPSPGRAGRVGRLRGPSPAQGSDGPAAPVEGDGSVDRDVAGGGQARRSRLRPVPSPTQVCRTRSAPVLGIAPLCRLRRRWS